MKKLAPLFFFLLIAGLSCTPATNEGETQEVAPMEEEPVSATEMAINQAVKDAYTVISFEEGGAPDFEAMRALFTTDAMFHNFRQDTLQSYGIDQFIEGLKGAVEGGTMKAFDEVELGGKTEYFGQIGHRISSYASYFDGADEIGERGVNSFQLLQIDGKWRISAVIWDVEDEKLPIPEKYLNDK